MGNGASTMPPLVKPPERVVVAGAGVVGASVAYFLARRGVRCTVVDRAGVASCASGKAGGFLALDWNDGSPVGPLARRSFALHEELAATLQLGSYRRLTCEAVALDGVATQPKQRKLSGVEWADLGAARSRPMGNEDTIAQVHPQELTTALLDAAAREAETDVRIGAVDGVESDADGVLTGVRVDGDVIPADVCVLALGPWTSSALAGLAVPPVYGQKYHSVVVEPKRTLNQAVFFQGRGDPEFYPRPDGTVYVCGFPDAPVPVQELPGAVEVREEKVAELVKAARDVSSEFAEDEAPVSLAQSCYLPLTADGVPAIGAVPGLKNAYVAAGHSCWGILNGPATGESLAELILDGEAKTVDLTPFSPSRFL